MGPEPTAEQQSFLIGFPVYLVSRADSGQWLVLNAGNRAFLPLFTSHDSFSAYCQRAGLGPEFQAARFDNAKTLTRFLEGFPEQRMEIAVNPIAQPRGAVAYSSTPIPEFVQALRNSLG